MTIPAKYQDVGEGTIASYNFTDIASGEGFVRFYAARLSGSDILTGNVVYSDTIETASNFVDTADTPVLVSTFNFDTTKFNLPRRMGGTAIVSIPAEIASTSATAQVTAFLKIVKADGTVVDLISGSGKFATSSSQEKMFSFSLVVPTTLIKKEDKIRLSVEQWRVDTSGSPAASTHYIGHDPKNRAAPTITTIDTNLIMDVPFRIDL